MFRAGVGLGEEVQDDGDELSLLRVGAVVLPLFSPLLGAVAQKREKSPQQAP